MSDYLTGKQLKAIDALMSGHTVAGAAAEAGISERTLWRWRTLPLFRSEMQQRAGESLAHTARRLSATMTTAPDVIDSIMTDAEAPAGVRLAAAKVALDSGLRLIELTELMQRLEDLEARYEQLS